MTPVDPRETRLREIAEVRLYARAVEAERNRILCDLAAEWGIGALTRLAGISGLTRARVHKIVTNGRNVPRSR